MDHKPGYLVISLDFELFWGMFDKVSLKEYGPHVLGEQTAIPRMLELFKSHNIHATWATLGMLMARNKEELYGVLPPHELWPTYEDERVSAYHHLDTTEIGDDEKSDPYHFGSSLVEKILATPGQEIANHTFSHFYCMDGHDNPPNVFEADLEAHKKISETYGVTTESMVFPRNQPSDEALRTCKRNGIHAYRGNETHFLYAPRKDSEQTLFIRGLRLLDHYLNISGHHTYALPEESPPFPVDIKASRFLRPWNKFLSPFESLRMKRIKDSMTHAAKCGEIFHLWWHPHNVGTNQKENFRNLEEILEHFEMLKEKYGMGSASMKDITTLASEQAPSVI